MDESTHSGSGVPTHRSVLLDEVVEGLRPLGDVGYRVIDATAGGGGHAFALLEASAPDGRLLALDADADALRVVEDRLRPFAGRFDLAHANFRSLAEVARLHDFGQVDAVLFDFGLSSRQLDTAGRGFSFRFDEPLDMRFDPHSDDPPAADLLNDAPEEELVRIVREYGEEPRARRVARAIVERRQRAPFERTGDLVAAVTHALGPSRGRIHPATKVFQAIRIAVNDELGALEQGLDDALEVLKPGGRIAAISFHSLEDRVVKWRFRNWADAGRVSIVTRKPLTASQAEREENPRSRSAKLRIAFLSPNSGSHGQQLVRGSNHATAATTLWSHNPPPPPTVYGGGVT